MAQPLSEGQVTVRGLNLRFLIIHVVLALLSVFILAFWVAPMRSATRQMYRALEDQKRQLKELNRQAQLAKQLKRDYERLRRLVGLPLKKFERGKLISQLVSEVSEAASQCGLSVSAFQPGEPIPERDGRWVMVPIEVTMDGTMKALAHFLAALRRMTPLTIVERVVLSSSQDGADRMRIQMRISRYVLIESDSWATSQRSGVRMPR
ncbi:MAG: type 4a pilus biogenesis protein PilO [Armatimonadota bacterium]|nr:type II secretion system protein M [Armatimonadota bacterium]MCX7776881.1 type II secretion system protein M [Armatimonadota bacterium]MDW8024433.1 type 4a pilus biogenesis protein PilO [Armatimonadota bacterium]